MGAVFTILYLKFERNMNRFERFIAVFILKRVNYEIYLMSCLYYRIESFGVNYKQLVMSTL